MTFSTKYIEVDFDLAQGVFQNGGNTHTVRGCRVSAQIVKAGGLSLGQASVAIYGLPLSVMNQLGTFGMGLTYTNRNFITVKAGDDPNSLAVVFTGTIQTAFMDGQSQPNVPFRVEAFTGLYEAMNPVPPTSEPGSQDAATLLSQMAKAANLNFENNGVDTRISCPYYPGTAVQQIEKCVNDAGIQHIIDNGTLSIWKPGQARQGAATLVSPETGLVDYPQFNSMGIAFRALFQPTFAFGQNLKVQSSITPACGTWTIYRLEYILESQTPNGRWFCDIMAAPFGMLVVAG